MSYDRARSYEFGLERRNGGGQQRVSFTGLTMSRRTGCLNVGSQPTQKSLQPMGGRVEEPKQSLCFGIQLFPVPFDDQIRQGAHLVGRTGEVVQGFSCETDAAIRVRRGLV